MRLPDQLAAGVMKSYLNEPFRRIVSRRAASNGLEITISVENLRAPTVGDFGKHLATRSIARLEAAPD